jgi:hypothetical protein
MPTAPSFALSGGNVRESLAKIVAVAESAATTR